MSEVLRLRVARAPRPLQPAPTELVPSHRFDPTPFLSQLLAAGSEETRRTAASAWIAAGNLPDDPPPLNTPLNAVDRALTNRDNRMTPEEIAAVFHDGVAGVVVAEGSYTDDRRLLGDALLACLLTGEAPLLAVRLNRLLLVCGLLELIEEHKNLVPDADAVFNALRWRVVVLPRGILSVPADRLSRRPAFADLYLVRKDWLRYEAAEVAHIENVLRGEAKLREHTRTTETEVTIFSETEVTVREQQDTQSTDRFELNEETSRQAALAVHVDGSLDAQGPAGPMTIHGHVGGSVDFSQETADTRALKTSHEAVSRAVKEIETRTRQTRTTRTLDRIVELNRHSIDNSAEKAHAIGIYRWVNKIDQLQVFRYPHRFLAELQIPEPGAWWRHLVENGVAGRAATPPTPFTVDGTPGSPRLSVDDIAEAGYGAIAARYRVVGLPAPPPPQVTAGVRLKFEPDAPAAGSDPRKPIRFNGADTLVVPTGYIGVSWNAEVQSWHDGGFGNAACSVSVAVGTTEASATSVQFGSVIATCSGDLPSETGLVPVSVMSDSVFGFGVNVVATCDRLGATLRTWQQAVYDLLAEAYGELQRKYDEAASAEATAAGVAIVGDNPARNLEIVRNELKKHVSEVLLGANRVGVPAIKDAADGYPVIDPSKMLGVAPDVSFIEQAFEWENLSYVLYPYHWARRDQWQQIAAIDGVDPDFAAFLRSGSARVIIPARPGFEQAVNFFLYSGIVWGGVQAPAPGEPWYLSLDAEIRAQGQAPADGTVVGLPWEVRLPTELVWLQADGALPSNTDVSPA
jgi:hypothetical protein